MADVKFTEAAQAAVTQAKAEGFEDVSGVYIGGKEFVFRPVLRSEWRGLLRKRNEALLAAGEDELLKAEVQENEFEDLLNICLLYTPISISKLPAGTVQVLADAILMASGFGGLDTQPVAL